MVETDEQQRTPTPNLNFAHLDADDDRDFDASHGSDGGSGGGHRFGFGGHDLEFDDDTVSAWAWPVGLVLVWLVVLLVEMVFFDTDPRGLSKLPVVMGAASQTVLLKPLTLVIAKMVMGHPFIGALLFIIDRLLVFIVMLVDAILAGFMHASMAHWFGNTVLLLMVSGAAYALHYPLARLVRDWLLLSSLGIFLTWLIVDFISFFVQGHHQTTSWLFQVSHSTTPIVGASVGLFGIVAMMFMIALRQLRISKWTPLVAIILFVMSLALLYMQWSNLSGIKVYTSVGAALKLAVIMHFVGYFIGVFRGLHFRGILR